MSVSVYEKAAACGNVQNLTGRQETERKESVSGKLTVPTRFQLMAVGVIIGRSSPRSGNLLFTFIVDCYYAITFKLNFCKQLLLNLNIT